VDVLLCFKYKSRYRLWLSTEEAGEGRMVHIMDGMNELEWFRTHGNQVFDVFETIPFISVPAITPSPSSPLKIRIALRITCTH
jgi:hypothetical protein